MGFDVTMQPPYILIEPGNSGQNLFSLNNISQFGVVFQVNASTTICSVGDVVYYDTANTSAIQEFGASTSYIAINENKIIFVEIAV
jgi:hypothetical protein